MLRVNRLNKLTEDALTDRNDHNVLPRLHLQDYQTLALKWHVYD